jgi:hypothetical protein
MLGLSNTVVRKCAGKGGGIAVFWRRGVNVVLRNFADNHIDVDVFEGDGYKWCFTGVYGFPQIEDRHKTWTLLRDLHAQDTLKTWGLRGMCSHGGIINIGWQIISGNALIRPWLI